MHTRMCLGTSLPHPQRIMAKEGYPFLFPLLLLAGLSLYSGLSGLGFLLLALASFIAYFFRDPERVVPSEEGSIVSPADGNIVGIAAQSDGTARISTFLSGFAAHVNRSPIAGEIESI